MNILLDLFLTFAKIGGFTFGGGYAMIALLDHECVEKKNWITAEELMNVTVIAESTPRPHSHKLCHLYRLQAGGPAGGPADYLGHCISLLFDHPSDLHLF